MTPAMKSGFSLASLSKVPVLRRLIPSLQRRIRLATGRRYLIVRGYGCRFLLDIQNLVDRRIAAWGRWEERQVERLMSEAEARRPGLFLDVGACWGYYSLIMAKLPYVRTILAFEPDRVNRAQLFGNIFVNEASDRITVRDFGLSDRSATVSFGSPGERNRGANRVTDDGAETIEVRALDDVLDISGETIFMKVDVEGHELKAVTGMARTLRNNDCFLQIECYEANLPALESLMAGLGYRKVDGIDCDHYFARR